jgi:predicted RNA polymerase sigma factor
MPATVPPPGEVAAQLRALLAAVDAGDMDATDTERAYLHGAVDALAAVAGSPVAPG